jgi:Leucine Rich repeat
MSVLVVCSSCLARLKVREQALGKRIKCPSCSEAFVAPKVKPSAEEPDLKANAENAVTAAPLPKAKIPTPVEDRYEESAEDETPEDRPKKKKRKKKKSKRNPAWALVSAESRPLLLFGGSGILAIEFFLLAAAVIAPSNPLRFIMAYFFAMLPISTAIFIGSLYVGSLFGALEIGEISITLIKGFFLVLIVNIVGLFPFGMFLAVVVWIAGIWVMFHMDGCDFWIVRVLIGINWTLNFIAQLIVVSVLAAVFPIDFDDSIGDNMPAGNNKIWDADAIKRLGGRVAFADDDDEAVIGISLENCPIRDAHLAHMKDIPFLRRLRLSHTPITDAGLAHLRECRKLEELRLTGTQVTDTGVRDLQQALPKCLIQR